MLTFGFRVGVLLSVLTTLILISSIALVLYFAYTVNASNFDDFGNIVVSIKILNITLASILSIGLISSVWYFMYKKSVNLSSIANLQTVGLKQSLT